MFFKPISQGTAEVISNTIDSPIKEKALQWKNCAGICTDGSSGSTGLRSS